MKKIGVAIVGGTGFGAGELLRLFTMHPEVSVASVISRSSACKPYTSFHPHLNGFYPRCFDSAFNPKCLDGFENKVVISALPHGESSKVLATLVEAHPDLVYVDLSGDLRIRDEALHAESYPHSPYLAALRKKAVYGLSELNEKPLATASVISNPGCLATASILALLPLQPLNLQSSIMVHAATGSSGSGKDPKTTTHHPVRHANFYAYKPLYHQHLGEIHETLTNAGIKADLSFVPHSLPVSRGIMCTSYVSLQKSQTRQEIVSLFQAFYKNRPFIRIQAEGCAELENVIASNHCDISIAVRGNTVVIHSAIDNLVKGMAGQAIQNINIRCGLPETTGLWFPSVRPV